MARTPSKMIPLGTPAPNFVLPDTEKKAVSLQEYNESKGYLVMFICNHCPYVKHIAPKLAEVTTEYLNKGIMVFGINSNDVVNFPDDSPEKMKLEKADRGYQFPYLFDESQEVAKAYDAACTPDFYLFDYQKNLVYRGQFDESRPGNNVPVTGKDLMVAMDAVLANEKPNPDQRPSLGCNIKWREDL